MDSNIKRKIEQILNDPISYTNRVGGGCISGTQWLQTESGKQFFVKHGLQNDDMFFCESNALYELSKARVIRIPNVIAVESDFLILENIERGKQGASFFSDFGRKFARLHRFHSNKNGFYENNYIGSTPQINIAEKDEVSDWIAFYFNKRLLFQFRLAEKNGYVSSSFRNDFLQLENNIQNILQGSEEQPSLLHGDLWSGNFLCDEKGAVVLIDPAVYYGHREADLAMTRLFGGFSPEFYLAYEEEFPLKEGWEYRENIYRLYHVLNHLNLFGKAYLAEAEYIVRMYVK